MLGRSRRGRDALLVASTGLSPPPPADAQRRRCVLFVGTEPRASWGGGPRLACHGRPPHSYL
eukprot:3713116-Lingulodinium_polyedra.AAC.1